MPQILMPYTVHLDHTLRVTPLNTLFAKGDSAAHRFELTILSAGAQDNLAGCTVSAKFYRMADSTVVSVPGSVEDGKAVVVLDAACYDYIGRFALTIAIQKGEDETTVFYGDGYMHGHRADTAISGEYIIYDINTLLEKIAEIDAATEAANTATSNADTAAANANTATGKANTAASSANTAATNANAAKDAANAAAGKIDNMTVSATPVSTGTATAELSTVDGHYHLALGLPKGDTGVTPQISVQVQTGAAGSEASVSVSGTAENPVIHLTIPRGDVGNIGALTINGKAPDSSGAVTLTMSDIDGLTINGKAPDGSGAVTLEMGDIDGLDDAIANAGGVKTVAGVSPDSAGNVALTAVDVGALPSGATAADSSKLGGQLPAFYAKAVEVAPLLYNNSGAHNAIYRGKDLGTAVTDAQWAAIAAGTFEDLYIGDYWTIGDVNWRIAAFDYYLTTGDKACNTHHVVIVPDTTLYAHKMNDSNVTTGGYVGSKMYTTGLDEAKTAINNAFGSAHILTHRQILCNAVTNGKPSGASWYDSTVELMTEQNVYGGRVFGAVSDGSKVPALRTVDKSQYPLFAFRHDLISIPNWFWLRDVVSNGSFARVAADGSAAWVYASDPTGVRPAFSIC